MRLSRCAVSLVVGAAMLLPPAFGVQAASFNPHLILTDSEMRDADAMDVADIAYFLSQKGGLGSCYDTDPIDGNLKGTAQLVSDAARRYHVNPKYVLALIQKESSAVETPQPVKEQLDWATGYALCDGCSKSSPSATKYRGLGKQIDAGAGWMDWYLKDEKNRAGLIAAGSTYNISQSRITPVNLATAALYSYTPHLHGNRLLWSIWQKWFGGEPPQFPDGTIVRNEKNGAVAVIQAGHFRPIANLSVLQTRFRGIPIIDVNEFDFRALEEQLPGRVLRFAEPSLVRTEDGSIYLLNNGTRRRFASPEAFAKLGFNPEELEDAAEADVSDYTDGEPLRIGDDPGDGRLLQDTRTGGIYFVRGEEKQPLLDRVLLDRFPSLTIKPATAKALAKLKTGEPVGLADGMLVKSKGDPTVYLISAGKRRAIKSETAFISLGYRWNQVRTTSLRLLNLHPVGDPIDL